ncbi:putative MFS glucose transporter [Aureobasidium subglaciale]|nr:putative MFS glucose transporter [Aureobasidium subglaciale]
MRLPKIGNVYFIAAIAIIGGALFGFDISSMSAIIATQPYKCYFNQQGLNDAGECIGPRADVQGGITASMAGGSWLAALCSGYLSDRLGRKPAVQIGAVIWVIGCIIVCASQNIAMLIVGRVINGFCVGICSAQIPVYISEIAPPSKRGKLVGAQQWAITWGIMIMFYISYGCSFINGTGAFRAPWALQMIPAIMLFFGMMLLPESPRWLASKDRWEETLEVLALTHGHGDPESPFVVREYNEIKEWIRIESEAKNASYLELFRPRMLNRTIVGIFMQIWSQLTVSSSIQYVINVVMTIPGLLLVDRVGRRPLLLVGAAFMALWLFANAGILGVYGTYPGPGGVGGNTPEASTEVTGAASKAVIACSYLFVASYAPTWGPVSWIYPSEIFPNRVRGKATALATSANWAFNFVCSYELNTLKYMLIFNQALGYFVPPAFINIRYHTYTIFGVFCVAMWIHVFLCFPETGGKPLEEVTAMFEDPNGIKYIGTPAWKTSTSTSITSRMERGQDLEKKLSNDEAPETHEVAPKQTL